MAVKAHPIVLLTGAGFTQNFGGFLADQMWEKILNQPVVYQTHSLRQTMLSQDNDLNFEKLYSLLRRRHESEYPPFLNALDLTFRQLDEVVRRNAKNSADCQINLEGLALFFRQFEPAGGQTKGFIFSLNQDLLFERMVYKGVPYLPGVQNELQCQKVDETRDIQKLRIPAEINLSFESLNVIKIHG